MELDYRAIGKRIKIERIKADLTQEKLAEKSGVSLAHMSNIETGTTRVSLTKKPIKAIQILIWNAPKIITILIAPLNLDSACNTIWYFISKIFTLPQLPHLRVPLRISTQSNFRFVHSTLVS